MARVAVRTGAISAERYRPSCDSLSSYHVGSLRCRLVARTWNRRPCGPAPFLRSGTDRVVTHSAVTTLGHFAAALSRGHGTGGPADRRHFCGAVPAELWLAPEHHGWVTSLPPCRADMEQAATPIRAGDVKPYSRSGHSLRRSVTRSTPTPSSARAWNRGPPVGASTAKLYGGAVTRSAAPSPGSLRRLPRGHGTGGHADRCQHCGALPAE